MEKGRIVIITGAPGTGKTTAASMAAKESSLEKSVHMHTDDFYHYLSKGAIPPHLPESSGQNLIVIEAFLEAAKRYVCGGYDVIVDGIIGPWFLKPWLKAVQDGYEVHYIILRADKEETMKRAVGRNKLDRETNMELVKIMWEQFNNLGRYESYVMDITDCSAEETVSMIKTEVERKTRLLFKKKNRKMLPTIEKAEQLLQEAEKCNPGPWGNHSRVAAHCAQKIAAQCDDLNPDKAYILGLLHDIGRKFGVRHLGHVSDGYSYMMSLGYDEAAKICLTHSFNNQKIDEYIGEFDTTDDELKMIEKAMEEVTMDDYDKLIQLCDALAGSEGILDIEERMSDVKRRYGSYPQEKWNSNLALKKHFEEKMGKDLYIVVEKDDFCL